MYNRCMYDDTALRSLTVSNVIKIVTLEKTSHNRQRVQLCSAGAVG